ncbi:MAG: hypothetical protein HY075_12775, partial [Deltaproteobacteria bacterium]|nr:hypothetical protein [Deltaproteobacteria bacterium]
SASSAGSGGTSAISTTTKTNTPLGTAVSQLPTTDPQCTIFANNAHDLAACLGCKQILCPCAQVDPLRPTVCLDTNQIACTADINQLVQCVHDNTNSGGAGGAGQCSVKCGTGQVADFAACVCRDATPSTSVGPAPGFEDTGTPYLEPGFVVGDRFCPPLDVGTAQSSCLLEANIPGQGGGATPQPLNLGVPPRYAQQAPANVYPDVGYLRWDLALDASQYGPAYTLAQRKPFLGTWASFPFTPSMYFQLKPDTQLANPNNSVNFRDCVEHFSGFKIDPTAVPPFTVAISSSSECQNDGSSGNFGTHNPTSVFLTTSNGSANVSNSKNGVATVPNISANGAVANPNLITFDDKANPKMLTAIGLNKDVTGVGLSDDGPDVQRSGTGLFSNIGYYKYTWGPILVNRTPAAGSSTAPVALASATVSGRVAINMNLGFAPASMIESSAASPLSVTSSVTTRDCTVNSNPFPCVTTIAYRAAGGGVLSQSLSPAFATNHLSSTVMALPTGVTAVSSPKIIEDTSQLDVTVGHVTMPARLRTFVRGDDGNIYMTRFENGKWFPWLSLGRPWSCSPGACGSGAVSTLPIVYQPQMDPSIGYTGAVNDGLSIVGEPVVVSLMSTNKVYANLGGLVSGAPLAFANMVTPAGATYTGVKVRLNANLTTKDYLTIYFDQDPFTPKGPGNVMAANQSVVLSGFKLTGLVGGTFNTPSGAAATIAAVCRPNNGGGTGVVAGCDQTANAPGHILIDVTGQAVTLSPGSSGLSSTARITQSDPRNGTGGLIGVFVRVSQMDSSDGLAGPYHNSIWYTTARVLDGVSFVAGQPWEFDKVENWSKWMLVYQNGNAPDFLVQGNPLVLLKGTVSAPRFYAFATAARTAGLVAMPLHPPIGQTGAVSSKVLGAFQINNWPIQGGGSTKIYTNTNQNPAANWYNYGTRLAIAFHNGFPVSTGAATLGDTSWSVPATMDINATAGIISEWTYADLSSPANNIRLFGMDIINSENPCWSAEEKGSGGFANADAASFSWPRLVAPCKYQKTMRWVEFDVSGAPTATCHGIYNPAPGMNPTQGNPNLDYALSFGMNFVGTPHAINLKNAVNPGPLDKTATQSPFFRFQTSIFLFGRAVCPDSSSCDPINPVLAYAAVYHNSECFFGNRNYDKPTMGDSDEAPDVHMYYPGLYLGWHENFFGNGTPARQSDHLLSSFNPTADVIPQFSYAMFYQGNEASMFFVTRDPSGSIAHGFWEANDDASGNIASGGRDFAIFTSGAYTN